MLADLFKVTELQMRLDLERLRAAFVNSTVKGTGVEEAVRAFLSRHLPRSYGLGHGEIMDTFGNRSSQTDVVITTAEHPFTYPPELPGLYLIEGVSAAGEVKAVLDAAGLEDGITKAAAFRKLRANPGVGALSAGNEEDLDRWTTSPPYFLLALGTTMKESTVLERLRNAVPDGTYGTGLDAVFVLGAGSAINFGKSRGKMQFRTPQGVPLPGWHMSAGDALLFDFMGWLTTTMQRYTRVSPIFPQYWAAARVPPEKTPGQG